VMPRFWGVRRWARVRKRQRCWLQLITRGKDSRNLYLSD